MRTLALGLVSLSVLSIGLGRAAAEDRAVFGKDAQRATNEIHSAIAARRAAFRACYTKQLERTPGLRGKIVLKFTIGTEGTVSQAEVVPASTTLDSRPVTRCVKNELSRVKFPSREASATVVYPFVFTTSA